MENFQRIPLVKLTLIPERNYKTFFAFVRVYGIEKVKNVQVDTYWNRHIKIVLSKVITGL